MELQLSHVQPRQILQEIPARLERYFEENGDYYHLYRIKGLILSFFAPFLLVVHVYLFLQAVETFSFITFVDLLLCLLLLLPWAVVPGLFLYAGAKASKMMRIWAWIWAILMTGAEIFWFVFLTGVTG
jgi:hypothetical protein